MAWSSRFVYALGVLLLVGGMALGSAGGVAARADASYIPTPEECWFLALINDYRAAHGLDPLALSATLGGAARNHSAQMAATDYFSHTLPDGTSWADNIRNYGYTYNTWIGENLAAGNYRADYTLLQWQRSAPHNANMLAPEFAAIGIGRAVNPDSQWGAYWTTTFGGYVDQTVSC